jgi:hypothetical protein
MSETLIEMLAGWLIIAIGLGALWLWYARGDDR